MKTSIIGYPRIGALRELKFASEKYFRQEITAEELLETAKNIRLKSRTVQKENGIDYIPSNDFSFYDNMLDAAVLMNAVPERYRALELPELDTYFAMARGYQGKNGDVKALAMKKWFNTNYHYMVPGIDDSTEIKLAGTKPFDEFLEAQKSGIKTKPVIIGAFTFLKLARFTGNKSIADFADAVSSAYCNYLAKLSELGAEWAEFDEPYLVTDLSAEDISLFVLLYNTKEPLNKKHSNKRIHVPKTRMTNYTIIPQKTSFFHVFPPQMRSITLKRADLPLGWAKIFLNTLHHKQIYTRKQYIQFI